MTDKEALLLKPGDKLIVVDLKDVAGILWSRYNGTIATVDDPPTEYLLGLVINLVEVIGGITIINPRHTELVNLNDATSHKCTCDIWKVLIPKGCQCGGI